MSTRHTDVIWPTSVSKFPPPTSSLFARRPNIHNPSRIAFLALGSLGDCLPLCALAAALPAQFRRRAQRQTHGADAVAPSSPPLPPQEKGFDQQRDGRATNSHAGDDEDDNNNEKRSGDPKRLRHAATGRGHRRRHREGASVAGGWGEIKCTVITHERHCGLLAGALWDKTGRSFNPVTR